MHLERLRQVRQSYDEIASVYHESRSEPWARPLVDIVFKTGQPARVLDLGCGSGANPLYIASLARELYVGIDFSLAMLARFRQELPAELRQRVDLVCADARMLPLKAEAAHIVTAIATVHHIPGQSQRVETLQEALRVCRRGGLLLITCWSREVIAHLREVRRVEGGEEGDYEIAWRWRLGKTVYRYYHLYDYLELAEEVEKATRKTRAYLLWYGLFRRGRMSNVIALLQRA